MAKDDDKIDYIQQRLDAVSDKVSDIGSSLKAHTSTFELHVKSDEEMQRELKRCNDILADNTSSLKDHIARTNLLEDYIKKVDARFEPVELDHIKRAAVKEWRTDMLKLLAKIGAAVTALGSLGVAAKFLLEFILSQ